MVRETLTAALLTLWLHFKPPSPPRQLRLSDAAKLERYFAEFTGSAYVCDPGPSLLPPNLQVNPVRSSNPHDAFAEAYPLAAPHLFAEGGTSDA